MAMSRGLKRSQPIHVDEIPRILKKRTLIFGEVDSSSEDEEPKVATTDSQTNTKPGESLGEKLDRLFPGWWEQDQHKPECSCDFCKLYHGQCDDDGVDGDSNSASLTSGQNEEPSPAAA